jgi:hypothetical protein
MVFVAMHARPDAVKPASLAANSVLAIWNTTGGQRPEANIQLPTSNARHGYADVVLDHQRAEAFSINKN